eukprot:313082-Rhodomonas_salina.1
MSGKRYAWALQVKGRYYLVFKDYLKIRAIALKDAGACKEVVTVMTTGKPEQVTTMLAKKECFDPAMYVPCGCCVGRVQLSPTAKALQIPYLGLVLAPIVYQLCKFDTPKLKVHSKDGSTYHIRWEKDAVFINDNQVI